MYRLLIANWLLEVSLFGGYSPYYQKWLVLRVASLGPVVLVRSYCRHCRCPQGGTSMAALTLLGAKRHGFRGGVVAAPPQSGSPPFRPPPCSAALRACSPLRRAPPQGFQPCPSRGLARSGVPPSRLGRAVSADADDY